ncbi:MAG: hypothetical protein MMC33_004210 [Icmadophila ericetorum]|nr:hypothetical protein [Icmadophila ericetorum]
MSLASVFSAALIVISYFAVGVKSQAFVNPAPRGSGGPPVPVNQGNTYTITWSCDYTYVSVNLWPDFGGGTLDGYILLGTTVNPGTYDFYVGTNLEIGEMYYLEINHLDSSGNQIGSDYFFSTDLIIAAGSPTTTEIDTQISIVTATPTASTVVVVQTTTDIQPTTIVEQNTVTVSVSQTTGQASASNSVSSHSPTTFTSVTTILGSPVSTTSPTSSQAPSESSTSGLSTSEKTGIGVGVGFGIPILVALVVAVVWGLRQRENANRLSMVMGQGGKPEVASPIFHPSR